MVDVTAENFASLRPVVEQLIQDCTFISIDTEFTGLRVSKEWENCLFDSVEERYRKVKHLVQSFTVLQCGLAIFTNDPRKSPQTRVNAYSVHCFNFYVFNTKCHHPATDQCFLMQPSAVEFLVQNSFDFQTAFTKGIPYLNFEQEAEVAEELKAKRDRLSNSSSSMLCEDDRQELDSLLSSCRAWVEAKDRKSKDRLQLEYRGELPMYMVCQHLMQHLPAITCKSSQEHSITIQPTTEAVLAQMRAAKSKPKPVLNVNSELDSAIGFGHIFRCLVKCKKPLVGHNMLLDLGFLYQKFYRPLPSTCQAFKSELHQLFPVVIDTKRLCFSLRSVLVECGSNLMHKTHLEGLYANIASKKSAHLKLNAPEIAHHQEHSKYGGKSVYFHEAAYDAYASGFVFLRIAHMAVSQGVRMTQPLPFSEYLLKLSDHFNLVNVIKGPVFALNLSGPDLPTPRPPWLVVQHRYHSKLSNREALSLVQCFKGLDYKEVGQGRSWSLWLAPPTAGMARDMCSLGIHPHLKIRRHSWWLDTPTGWRITRLTGLGSTLLLLSLVSLGLRWSSGGGTPQAR